MDLVDLAVFAAAKPASALHQIVRLGLYPRPEAVGVKWLLRLDMVVDEIAPGGDWFLWQAIEGEHSREFVVDLPAALRCGLDDFKSCSVRFHWLAP